MRISGRVVVAALTLTLMPSGFGANSVAWGSTVNGLRLGVAFGSAPSRPMLRVLLQNTSSAVQEIVIGHETGKGPSYDSMKFIATAPDGKEQIGLHRGVYIPIAGLVLPISVSLNPGATHEVEIPLQDILYVSRTIVALDALVKQGYSVTVRFETSRGDADWAKLSHAWIGTMTSGEIAPTH